MMRFDKLLIIVVLLLLPLDASDYFQLNLGPFRISPSAIIVGVTFIVVGLKQLATQTPILMRPNLPLILLLAFTWLLPGLIWKTVWVKDLKMALNFLQYLALFYMFSQVIRDEAFLKRVLRVFLIAATCLAVLTVLKSLGLDMPGLERKTAFTFSYFQIGVVGLEDNFVPALSLFLAGGLPLLWQKTLIKQRWLRLSLTLLFLTAGLITGARGLYVTIAAQVMAWLYLGYFRKLPSRRKLIALIGSMIGIIVLAILSIPIFDFLKSFRPTNVDNRLDGYILGIKLAFSNVSTILFGFGKGDFTILNNQTVVHNFFEDLIITGGIVNLSLILSLLLIIFFRLAAVPRGLQFPPGNLKNGLIIGFFGVVFVGMFDSITTSIVFWTYLAILYSFTLIPRARATNVNFARAYQVSRV
jgi:hypothetical protein